MISKLIMENCILEFKQGDMPEGCENLHPAEYETELTEAVILKKDKNNIWAKLFADFIYDEKGRLDRYTELTCCIPNKMIVATN